jgi:hypothetical protein
MLLPILNTMHLVVMEDSQSGEPSRLQHSHRASQSVSQPAAAAAAASSSSSQQSMLVVMTTMAGTMIMPMLLLVWLPLQPSLQLLLQLLL